MPEHETVREGTSIKIKPSLWKEVRINAIKDGKTVSELLEEAIEAWLKSRKKK
jgi:hypothetical protein